MSYAIMKQIIISGNEVHTMALWDTGLPMIAETKRNVLKRRINEVFRLHKGKLYAKLNERNKQINIAIIYQKQEIQTYKIIEQKINLHLSRLIEEL